MLARSRAFDASERSIAESIMPQRRTAELVNTEEERLNLCSWLSSILADAGKRMTHYVTATCRPASCDLRHSSQHRMLLFTNFTISLLAAPSDHNDAPYQQLDPPTYLQPFPSHFLHISFTYSHGQLFEP